MPSYGWIRENAGNIDLVFRWIPTPFVRLLNSIFKNSPTLIGLGVRYLWLRRMARRCGNAVFLGPDVEFRCVQRLELGNNVSIHRWCFVDAGGGLRIGDDVSIAHGVSLISVSHSYAQGEVPIRDQPIAHSPIIIGDDVWIGTGTCILSGVSITSRVIVGANSVVTRSITDSGIYAGCPARPIGALTQEMQS